MTTRQKYYTAVSELNSLRLIKSNLSLGVITNEHVRLMKAYDIARKNIKALRP